MKETLTTDSGYSSTSTSSGKSSKPYFYMVYKSKGDGICTFEMQNPGNCRVNGANLISVDSTKSGATAEVTFSGISVSVNPNELGKYSVEIRVENPTDGETYVFTAVVDAY